MLGQGRREGSRELEKGCFFLLEAGLAGTLNCLSEATSAGKYSVALPMEKVCRSHWAMLPISVVAIAGDPS